VQELVGAVREYGVHLRSHTAVLRHLGTTTEQLQAAAMRLADAVATSPITQLTQVSPEPTADASGSSQRSEHPEACRPGAEVHTQRSGRRVIDAEAWREPFSASELRHPNLPRTANRYAADIVDRLLDRAADALDLAERERNSLRDRLFVVEARLALLTAHQEPDADKTARSTSAPPFPTSCAPSDADAPRLPGGSPTASARPERPCVPPVWEVTPLRPR
jgi:hypothetical protein